MGRGRGFFRRRPYIEAARPTAAEACERLRDHEVSHKGPVEHPGGDRSLYVEDPEGNVVEVWDFFRRREGAAEGVAALR